MSGFLSLFIKPPFNPWSQWHSYGREVPEPPSGPRYNNHLRLSIDSDHSGLVYAACAGKLSIHPPAGIRFDPKELVRLSAEEEPIPRGITIYLHLSPFLLRRNAEFTRLMKGIIGFVYLNVEASSLDFGASVDRILIPSEFGAIDTPDVARRMVVNRFLDGELDIPVSTGALVGNASTEDAPSGTRQLGFAALTTHGPIDPAHFYDSTRSFLQDGQPVLDDFFNIVQRSWPVIDPSISVENAIQLTAAAIFPMAVLRQLKNDRNLNYQQWRQVGDNQKSLYRGRLNRRYAQGIVGLDQPVFEFDDIEYHNIFQLESIVEFFANFDDPFVDDAAPMLHTRRPLEGDAATQDDDNFILLDGNPNLSRVIPGRHFIYLEERTTANNPSRMFRIVDVDRDAHRVRVDHSPTLEGPSSWRIDLYVKVNFLQLEGENATADGTIISLNEEFDLTTIKPRRQNVEFDDLIILDRANNPNRNDNVFALIEVDPENHTVTVDADPALTDPTTSWKIIQRPVLVVIDPIGSGLGLTGKESSINAPNIVRLKTPDPKLQRINLNFDTIYFHADTHRETKVYRITAADYVNHTVTLDGTPIFEGG